MSVEGWKSTNFFFHAPLFGPAGRGVPAPAASPSIWLRVLRRCFMIDALLVFIIKMYRMVILLRVGSALALALALALVAFGPMPECAKSKRGPLNTQSQNSRKLRKRAISCG